MLCQPSPIDLNSWQDCKKLYQLLDFCQQKSLEEPPFKIVSIPLEIEPVDPLIALYKLAKSDHPQCYFEQRDSQQSIAAINTAISFETAGSERFTQVQTFIKNCLNNCLNQSLQKPLQNGISRTATIAPHFFCSFTFFDEVPPIDAPFPAASVFLPQWQVSCHHNRSFAIRNLVLDRTVNLQHLVDSINQDFQTIRMAEYGLFNLPKSIPNAIQPWEIPHPQRFKSAVSSALQSIRSQQFDKIVLAHAIDVVARLPFQWVHSLHNLRQLHPDCHVFLTSNGRGQSFIGASPERLLSIHNRQLFTDALAGSAPRGRSVAQDADLAQRLWNSQKERHEHQVVVDFITQRLMHLGLDPDYTAEPVLLQLANIQHLHTPIQATLSGRLHPLEILAELHPTPAVAGLPRDRVCQQIQRYETFERSLYAAPIGWVDAAGNAEFIVGIRSALIEGNRARLYAGAGIVEGSDPDKELAETQLKFQALLRALV